MLSIETPKIVVRRWLDGEALIEIREDAQILSKRFTEMPLVEAHTGKTCFERLRGWKPRPHGCQLPADGVRVWLWWGVTLDLSQHQRPVYEARENLANRVRPFFDDHQMEIDHRIHIAQRDESARHDRQHAIDDLGPRTPSRRTQNEKQGAQRAQGTSSNLQSAICNLQSATSLRTPVPG